MSKHKPEPFSVRQENDQRSADDKLNEDPVDDDLPIRSPCVSNCCLDDQDVCLGCFRHIDEIIGWHSANNEERRQIVNNARARHR